MTSKGMQRTKDVPQVSALENSLGKTLKSTAKMQIIVINIIWARYTVTNALGDNLLMFEEGKRASDLDLTLGWLVE